MAKKPHPTTQPNHKARKTKSASLQFIKLINEIKSHESKGMTIPTNLENTCAVGTKPTAKLRLQKDDGMISFSLGVSDVTMRLIGGLLISYYLSIRKEFQLLITSALGIAFKLFVSPQGIFKNVYLGVKISIFSCRLTEF